MRKFFLKNSLEREFMNLNSKVDSHFNNMNEEDEVRNIIKYIKKFKNIKLTKRELRIV